MGFVVGRRAVAVAVLCSLGCSWWVSGCGGGGGGSDGSSNVSGSPSPSPSPSSSPITPTGSATAIRLDIRTGASAAPVSLQDQQLHLFTFPAVQGQPFSIQIDTTPTGQSIAVQISELASVNGSVQPTNLVQSTVTTPYTTTVAGSGDTVMDVFLYDPYQKGLTLSTMSAAAQQPLQNTTSFKVYVQVAGDSFKGFSSQPENAKYNDLASSQDKQNLVNDLIAAVNTIWSQIGVQIDTAGSGFGSLTSAQVSSVVPALVQNGVTIMDAGDLNTSVPARQWGLLGAPASDPNFGLAADVFLVQQSASNPNGDVVGFNCGIKLRAQGGILEGNGLNHALIFTLADSNGNPRPFSLLSKVFAHELAHFLSLEHTTDSNFAPDDITDTPFSTKAQDSNGNGALDPGDTGPFPDQSYLMFLYLIPGITQTTMSPEQGRAIQGYLSIRNH